MQIRPVVRPSLKGHPLGFLTHSSSTFAMSCMAVFCHNLGASTLFCLRHRAKARRKICFPCIRTLPVPVAQPSRARKATIIHPWTLRPSIISTCIGLASSSAIFISMLAKKLWDEPRYHASALVFCPPAIPRVSATNLSKVLATNAHVQFRPALRFSFCFQTKNCTCQCDGSLASDTFFPQMVFSKTPVSRSSINLVLPSWLNDVIQLRRPSFFRFQNRPHLFPDRHRTTWR